MLSLPDTSQSINVRNWKKTINKGGTYTRVLILIQNQKCEAQKQYVIPIQFHCAGWCSMPPHLGINSIVSISFWHFIPWGVLDDIMLICMTENVLALFHYLVIFLFFTIIFICVDWNSLSVITNVSCLFRTINAGKTNKINEDQSVVKSFVINVPPEFREEDWGPEKVILGYFQWQLKIVGTYPGTQSLFKTCHEI